MQGIKSYFEYDFNLNIFFWLILLCCKWKHPSGRNWTLKMPQDVQSPEGGGGGRGAGALLSSRTSMVMSFKDDSDSEPPRASLSGLCIPVHMSVPVNTCTGACMCINAHTYVHMHVNTRVQSQVSSSEIPLTSFEVGPLTGLEHTDGAVWSGQGSLMILSCLPQGWWDHKPLLFCFPLGSWDWNSIPHACTTNIHFWLSCVLSHQCGFEGLTRFWILSRELAIIPKPLDIHYGEELGQCWPPFLFLLELGCFHESLCNSLIY